MAANADPTITNSAGHDAVYEAELNDKKDVVDWLLGHCENLEEGVASNAAGEEEVVEVARDEKEELEKKEKEKEKEREGKGKGKDVLMVNN